MINEDPKKFWENCDTTFAHITPNRWLKSRESLVSSFSNKFGPFDPENKVIVDYGIGASHFGVYLMENINVKKYIGIDIAQRSLDAARDNLSKYNQDKISLMLTPVDFSKLDADMFCSFAVIQHFPSEEYLNNFLTNLKNSEISELILQIRHAESNTFSNDYSTQTGAMMACQTNEEYVTKVLEKYECVKKSSIDDRTKYQHLHFKLK